jgi:hypothetical protein
LWSATKGPDAIRAFLFSDALIAARPGAGID